MTSALLSTKLSVALDRGDHGNGMKLVSEENRVRGDVISPENDAGFGLSSQRGTSRLPKSTLIICGLGPARDEALPVAADKSSENLGSIFILLFTVDKGKSVHVLMVDD